MRTAAERKELISERTEKIGRKRYAERKSEAEEGFFSCGLLRF